MPSNPIPEAVRLRGLAHEVATHGPKNWRKGLLAELQTALTAVQQQGDGEAGILRTAAEYHYAQAACPRDQFGNTSNHRNPRLEAWHRQVADAITAIIAPPSAKEKKT